jgi:CRP-like cAMP-binding protein
MTAADSTVYAPTLVGKLFALRQVRPFDRLTDAELTLLAEKAQPRSYPPGVAVHAGLEPLLRLLVVVDGELVNSAGDPAGPILGVASLLNHTAVGPIVAGPAAGARLLEISGRHFFTLARECPEFVIGLLELGAQGARIPAP